MTRIVAHPHETTTWDRFREVPAPAVALDGYVSGPTRSSPTHASFDHHVGVDRMATRATCEQVALSIRFGPLPLLHDPDRLDIHVNHADEDVTLSVWLIERQERVDDPRVRRLVDAEGLLDTTGGCCIPRSDLAFLETFAWIFEPCRGHPSEPDAIEVSIRQVGRRIDAYLAGEHGRVPVRSGFEVLERRRRVAAITEHGPLARTGLAGAEIDVYASLRYRGDELHVTIGKTSPYAPYDLARAFDELSRREGIERDGWGGGETIGGSPRRNGTRLEPATILDVLESCRDDRTGPFLTQPARAS